MGSVAGEFNWTIEDDFRLRKAAENGVSFESLARDDIQFSKRYTIKELEDRWQAILYDPIVAAEASSRMLEFEHCDSPPFVISSSLSNNENRVLVSGKRKPESLRKRYYAMRKKMRDDHPSNPPDTSFPNEQPDVNESFVNVDAGINLDFNALNNEEDDFKEIFDLLDIDETELPAVIAEPLIENVDEYPVTEPNQNQNQMCGEGTTAVHDTNSYLMELSKNLLDLDMVDDNLPILDADGNLIDSTYIDGLSSCLLDSPNKDVKCDISVDKFLDNNNGQPQFVYQETRSFEDLLPPSKPSTSGLICTLNTEDPDIPSNDDVFLLNLVPSTSQEMLPPSKFIRDYPPVPKMDFRAPKKVIPKGNIFEQSQFPSPFIRSQSRSEMVGNHRIKQDGPKDRNRASSSILSRSNLFLTSEKMKSMKIDQEINRYAVSTFLEDQIGSSDIFANCAQSHAISAVKQEETSNVEMVSKEVVSPIMVASPPPVEEEALSYSSDDYIPNFFDIEAMILDEDPSLDEQHIYLNGIGSSEFLQTLKYDSEDNQKKIIRLEQAAGAFMKKDMTSRGAFAILQGWHTKYYMKKPEVLIGRATEECNVDIDLGKEGGDCRVSRRQAIINMDAGGSFRIKNLGKYPIFVNSNELATNKSMSLTSSCLIEIKEMSFLFETSEACVKQYVDNLKKKADMGTK